jgi:hypothetical protein
MWGYVRRRTRGSWIGVCPVDERVLHRSREGVLVAREGNTPDPGWGQNRNPANRSTREGNVATGCDTTGMPTACGISPLQGWEEVNTRHESFDATPEVVRCSD